ncbi:MAG: TlpA family protein disulfide reductase [Sedimentitalea sp.]
MHLFRLMILYMALALGANAALADQSAIAGLRTGDMKKLNFHSEPRAASSQDFVLADDAGTATLAMYQGQYIVLNFWATWCAPCRKEMPHLEALQRDFGGDAFQVVTLATGRNSPAGIKKFFAENGIDSLTRHQDPKQRVAREMAVLGLPVTVILNPEGEEIARLIGDADWNSPSARAIVAALIAKADG